MKKTLLALLLVIVMTAAALPISADNVQVTFSGYITLREGTMAPEDGLPVTVFLAKRRSISEIAVINHCDIAFEGTETESPNESHVFDLKYGYKTIAENTVTIPGGLGGAEYTLDALISTRFGSVDSSDISNYFIGYKIATDEYIGFGYERAYELETDIYAERIYKKVSIDGKITVPEHTEELRYTVVAEGNREKDYNENGSYEASRDYTFKCSGTIAADETSVDYSMVVMPDTHYSVYVVFDDKEYIRQEKEISVSESNKTVDFSGFKKSKVYSGTVKLPDTMDTFINLYGEEVYGIGCTIGLQSASAPYYYLDTEDFYIDTETKTAEFTLKDDIGTDGVIIYFEIDGDIIDLYSKGIYKNDSESVPCRSGFDVLTEPRNDMTVCISEGKTVYPVLEYDGEYSGSVNDIYSMYAIAQPDSAALQDFENTDLSLRCYPAYDETEEISEGRYADTYYCTIPGGYDYNIALREHKAVIYANDSGFSDDFEAARLYTCDDSPHLIFTPYNPASPLCRLHDFFVDYRYEDESAYYLYTVLYNKSDFDCEGLFITFALFDENNRLLFIKSDTDDAYAHENMVPSVEIDADLIDKAKYLNLFVWTGKNNMKPFTQKIYLDNFELTPEEDYSR